MDKTIQEKLQQSTDIFMDIINQDAYNKIQQLISDTVDANGEIIFCGVGKNWYICEKIVKTWISLGIRCQALDCVHALHGDLGMLQGKHKKLIIYVSKSGTTKELINLVNAINVLRDNNIITDLTTVGFYLNKKADAKLYDYLLVPSSVEYKDVYEFDSRNVVPSLSINSMQMVLDLMGISVFENHPALVENYKFNHLGGNIGKQLTNDIISI